MGSNLKQIVLKLFPYASPLIKIPQCLQRKFQILYKIFKPLRHILAPPFPIILISMSLKHLEQILYMYGCMHTYTYIKTYIYIIIADAIPIVSELPSKISNCSFMIS